MTRGVSTGLRTHRTVLARPTFARRDLYAVLDDEAWSALRAVSDGVTLWFRPAAGEAHLVDLSTGSERIVGGLPATSTFQPLEGGRFLVTGRGTSVIAPC